MASRLRSFPPIAVVTDRAVVWAAVASPRLAEELARRAPAGMQRNVEDIVADLAEQAGINIPAVIVFADSQPRALATGLRRHPVIACTTGLVDLLDSEQLRAVLAHGVVHLANNDSLRNLETTAAQLALSALIRHEIVRVGKRLGHRRIASAASLVLAPALAGAAVRRRAGAEQRAEADTALLLGRPNGLRDALAALAPARRGWLQRLRIPGVRLGCFDAPTQARTLDA